ncbi:MAG: GNAT family N-acetyltransferase [Streptosporangiaceae bacterium]|nr:GNAT family N-acetyltransferase [Streptosporangiaceae bacterium]
MPEPALGRSSAISLPPEICFDAPRRLVDVLVVSPLAVLPTCQGRGVGSRLMRRALQVMASGPQPLAFLEGPPGYYSRFGFEPAVPKGFRRPSLRIPEPAFMVRLLPAFEPWMTGTVVYADPFWRHDCVGLRDHAI